MSEPLSSTSAQDDSVGDKAEATGINHNNGRQSKRDNNYHVYPVDVRNTYHSPASTLSYKSKQVIRQAQDPHYATAPRIAHFLYEVFITFFLVFSLFLSQPCHEHSSVLFSFLYSIVILCTLFCFSSRFV